MTSLLSIVRNFGYVATAYPTHLAALIGFGLGFYYSLKASLRYGGIL